MFTEARACKLYVDDSGMLIRAGDGPAADAAELRLDHRITTGNIVSIVVTVKPSE